MRKLLFLIISIFSLTILGCMPEVPEVKKNYVGGPKPFSGIHFSYVERINPEQPINIGQEIYKDFRGRTAVWEYKGNLDDISWYDSSDSISYTYLGIDEKNNIIVMYKYVHSPHRATGESPRSEQLILKLPLSPKKQTILMVKRVRAGDPGKELLITVVDEFNRIIIEETGKTQTK